MFDSIVDTNPNGLPMILITGGSMSGISLREECDTCPHIILFLEEIPRIIQDYAAPEILPHPDESMAMLQELRRSPSVFSLLEQDTRR
jgi:hypothetical protein